MSCWYLNCYIGVIKNHFVSYGRQRCISKGNTQVMLLCSKVIKYSPSKAEQSRCLLAHRLLLPAAASSRAVGTQGSLPAPSRGQQEETTPLSPAPLPCSRGQRCFNGACQLFQVHFSKCSHTLGTAVPPGTGFAAPHSQSQPLRMINLLPILANDKNVSQLDH